MNGLKQNDLKGSRQWVELSPNNADLLAQLQGSTTREADEIFNVALRLLIGAEELTTELD